MSTTPSGFNLLIEIGHGWSSGTSREARSSYLPHAVLAEDSWQGVCNCWTPSRTQELSTASSSAPRPGSPACGACSFSTHSPGRGSILAALGLEGTTGSSSMCGKYRRTKKWLEITRGKGGGPQLTAAWQNTWAWLLSVQGLPTHTSAKLLFMWSGCHFS